MPNCNNDGDRLTKPDNAASRRFPGGEQMKLPGRAYCNTVSVRSVFDKPVVFCVFDYGPIPSPGTENHHLTGEVGGINTNEAPPQTDEMYRSARVVVCGLRSSLQGRALVIRARSSVGPRTRGRPEPTMSIARSVAEILREHVVLEVELIDRMYLNVYVPHLQSVGAVVGYLRVHRGQRFASTTAVTPMTEAFIRNIDQFVSHEGIDLVAFQKWQRKDDVTQKYLRRFRQREGVLYVGKAQEKARVMRTERRRSRHTGGTYPWIVESTAMVNHYYFYCVDEDFGPFFVRFCSYFPYNAKLCINGNEYLKRQLAKRGVAFEALDNGVKSCANPKLMQRLCDELSAAKIDRLLRKWLKRLPHPFPPRDRAAGYRYDLSILQAEFSLTQVLDQPVTARIFFEEVICENLDIGRPSQVSLVFHRRSTAVRQGNSTPA